MQTINPKGIRNVLKTVWINLLVFLVLLVVLNLVSAVLLKVTSESDRQVNAHELPCFEDKALAKQIFEEQGVPKFLYQSFSGWKHGAYEGKYVNIGKNGLRQHQHVLDSSQDIAVIGVFGGSTVWGAGSKDSQTIPAYLDAVNTNFKVVNNGVMGFNSRQQLSKLVDAYKRGVKYDYVVFYDGVNEALLCREGLDVDDHLQSIEFREKVDNYKTSASSYIIFRALKRILFDKTLLLTQRLNPSRKEEMSHQYECHSKPEKTKVLARNLIENWKVAKKLVNAHGGEFIAILQPQLFSGEPNRTYLEDHTYFGDFLKEEYLSLYPEIKRRIQQEQLSWVYDFTDAFDGDQEIYYDICHTNHLGNLIISKRLSRILKSMDSVIMPGIPE